MWPIGARYRRLSTAIVGKRPVAVALSEMAVDDPAFLVV
jgi:hypothetical protein